MNNRGNFCCGTIIIITIKGDSAMEEKTIKYYNRHAKSYYQNTVDLKLDNIYQEFLSQLKDNAHILDAGCGSGRDSLFFLKQGYQVTAIDAAKELVKLSSKLLGQEVLQLRFQELEFEEEFDGIWACASLLHISRDEIDDVLERFSRALVKGGVIYMSFKYGDKEVYEKGRFFNYYDEDSFQKLVDKFVELEVIKLWQTIDVREDRDDEF